MLAPGEFLRLLASAVGEFRREAVPELIRGIDAARCAPKEAAKALGLLRKKRWFSELEQLAGLFACVGRNEPVVLRQYSQALLDQGRLEQGESVLRRLLAVAAADPVEGPEIRGLLGRAAKQRYVATAAPGDLRDAVAAYLPDWQAEPDRNTWHGINVVALVARARRDGVDAAAGIDERAIARRILDRVTDAENPPVWDRATALEAAIALGDLDRALAWLKSYAPHPDADAFELGSTLRQLREIWQLDDTPPGRAILPILQLELLRRQGGSVELAPGLSSRGFEATYGNESAVQLEWLESLFERCKSIGRVFDPATGKPQGTGFLARADSLRPSLGLDLVFVTNSHVVSDDAIDEAPLRPEQAAVEFTRLPGRPKVLLGALRFIRRRGELDVAVLALAEAVPAAALPTTQYAPVLPQQPGKPQRIYVAGHPEGRELTVSLYDNDLAEYAGPFVRYRSPTEPGSSGAPVFNRRWDAFALHHRADRERSLNEGVLFDAIRAAG